MLSPANPSQLLVALRKSALSLCHAQYIRDRLLAHYPECEITLRGITTQGDRILEKALADIGGKGLFIEEIENAMRDGRADVAVHSLKDMPMEMAPGFTIAAVPVREDPRDTLVCNKYASIEALPDGAIVGTSSLRREAQLREKNPKLNVRLLRGNVNTRVRKLDEGQYDAMILAAAGLNRLEQNHRISAFLEPADFLPAVGQGALAIECRVDDPETLARLQRLDHRVTAHAVAAERAFLARLQGDCKTPLAAHATVDGARLSLEGLVGAPDGSKLLRHTLEGTTEDAAALGTALAEELLKQGADRLLSFTTTELVGGE